MRAPDVAGVAVLVLALAPAGCVSDGGAGGGGVRRDSAGIAILELPAPDLERWLNNGDPTPPQLQARRERYDGLELEVEHVWLLAVDDVRLERELDVGGS